MVITPKIEPVRAVVVAPNAPKRGRRGYGPEVLVDDNGQVMVTDSGDILILG